VLPFSFMAAAPRYLIINAVMGAVIGLAFGVALLCTNTLNSWALLTASQDPIGATAIFLIGSMITLTPFVVVTAIIFCRADDLE
jgi:hypothetical protein